MHAELACTEPFSLRHLRGNCLCFEVGAHDLGSQQRLLGELLLKMGSSVSVIGRGDLTAACNCLKGCDKGSEFKLLDSGGQCEKAQYAQITAGEIQNGH